MLGFLKEQAKKSWWCSVLRCHRTFPQGWKAKRRDDKLFVLLQSRRMKPQWQINKWVSAFTCTCFHPCHSGLRGWEGGATFSTLLLWPMARPLLYIMSCGAPSSLKFPPNVQTHHVVFTLHGCFCILDIFYCCFYFTEQTEKQTESALLCPIEPLMVEMKFWIILKKKKKKENHANEEEIKAAELKEKWSAVNWHCTKKQDEISGVLKYLLNYNVLFTYLKFNILGLREYPNQSCAQSTLSYCYKITVVLNPALAKGGR